MNKSNTEIPLLKLENVTFQYGKKSLLKNANLIINKNESVGIVGDNGTGKSTIVKLVLGLLKPQNGKVELFGEPASWKINHPNLGYIGDPSHNSGELGLPDGISVQEMVQCFRQICKIPLPSNPQIKIESIEELWELPLGDFFEELINLLNIEKLYSRDVGKLSNGERKKLMTLLALGKQPDLLIADETTEGLDKNAKPIILDIVEAGVKARKFALLWISHRWDEIVRLGSSIYELSPHQTERGILKKLTIDQLDIDINLNSEKNIESLKKDLHFSLLGTLLASGKSQEIRDTNILIKNPK